MRSSDGSSGRFRWARTRGDDRYAADGYLVENPDDLPADVRVGLFQALEVKIDRRGEGLAVLGIGDQAGRFEDPAKEAVDPSGDLVILECQGVTQHGDRRGDGDLEILGPGAEPAEILAGIVLLQVRVDRRQDDLALTWVREGRDQGRECLGTLE